MQPFRPNTILTKLKTAYPQAEDLIEILKDCREEDRLTISRLWMSEGIPFAFKELPCLYEEVRVWLSNRLDIDPKEITIIGSGRIGESLTPGENMGRPFGAHSDLDLVAISNALFEQMKQLFFKWGEAYEAGQIKPKNKRETRFWNENLRVCDDTIQRGFIDANKIPNRGSYSLAKKIAQSLFLLPGKIKVSEGGFEIRTTSLRVYRDWNSFMRQVSLNLKIVAESVR
ncbi:MAG TPA: hypothetical protein ENH51_01935 [Euryarchaeota archaeon]|nr:hypothetical protein [Euryarchaeota archaeon]